MIENLFGDISCNATKEDYIIYIIYIICLITL